MGRLAMLYAHALLFLAGLAGSAAALSGMATTTRYYDGLEGACGCGTNGSMFPWQAGLGGDVHTAAGSQALFDAAGGAWCGPGCGQCFRLTSTGTAPPGQGTGGAQGQSITVLLTNLCPYRGNEQWCPNPGQQNPAGYAYHFDIMTADRSQAPVLGDNPIVSFESVECPGVATADYAQCVCH